MGVRCAAARRLGAGIGIMLALTAPRGAEAQATITIEEALALAFPAPLTVERRTAFLDEADLSRARERAGPDVDVTQSVVTYYAGMREGVEVGRAYFDAHRVRTLPEVLMVVVSPASAIDRIEVVRFAEPPEYRAPDGWLQTFETQVLDDDLSLKGAIVNITGATLTSIATTKAARRVLAVHAVIVAREGQKQE